MRLNRTRHEGWRRRRSRRDRRDGWLFVGLLLLQAALLWLALTGSPLG